MKTLKFLTILLAAGAAAACSKDNKEITYTDNMAIVVPDATFEQYLFKLYDTNNDKIIQYGEIKNVKELSIDAKYKYPETVDADGNPNGNSISSIEGIEYFTSLVKLKFINADEKNNLSILKMDVSKNHKLTVLDCSYTGVSELTVGNIPLDTLKCSYTALKYSTTDLRGLKSLKYLDFNKSNVFDIDLTGNTGLTYLDCSNNPLSHIDLSKNTKLERLICNAAALTILSVENSPALKELQCQNNPIKTLDLSNNKALEKVDCTKNEWLTTVFVWSGWNKPADWIFPKDTEIKTR